MSESAPPSAKRRKLDFSEDIKLIVGASKKQITVHKSVLTKSSAFFKACCEGHDWKEKSTKTIKLPEQETAAFSSYLHWLYTGEVLATEDDTVIDHADQQELQEHRDISRTHYEAISKLAVLANQLADDTFANAVTNAFILSLHKLRMAPNFAIVSEVYSDLPTSSPMRKLLVDTYRDWVSIEYVGEAKNGLPHDFIFDMMLSFERDKDGRDPKRVTVAKRCTYHIHNDKVPECT